jgi:hypothetical protein
MLAQLKLVSLALNPMAPSPTATMVRIDNGLMQAFGGTFCISVPVGIELGCCFNPSAVSTFFRKKREAVAYTIQKKKLVLQEGKEKLSVPCLPPEEMVTLDVLGKAVRGELDTTHLRSLHDVINPANSRIWAQGVSFRYGMMEATNNAVVISAISNLDDDLEFNLPVDAVRALMAFKSKMVSVICDGRAVKFCFEDGSSLCSLSIDGQMPDTSQFFDGEWVALKLKEDLLTVACDTVTFDKGTVRYKQESLFGEIEGVCSKQVSVSAYKKSLDPLLKVSTDIHVSEDGFRLMAIHDTCRAICPTLAYKS